MYPMKMTPALKDYIWGGDRLRKDFGKQTDLKTVAESWEVSCYPGFSSRVENGLFAGQSLADVLRLHPEFSGYSEDDFPILIKLIDSRQPLSLQVHPNDSYARRYEKQSGKNEMWYVVDCDSDAELILGFREPLTQSKVVEAIKQGRIMETVRRIRVKPGDCYTVPAGMLHAIGAGILIVEVQQNSDVTYRVYDFDRCGADGKPRELHVQKAVDVLDTTVRSENCALTPLLQVNGCRIKKLCDWSYFKANLLEVQKSADLVCGMESFTCLLVLNGSMWLKTENAPLELKMGGSVFLPAGLGPYTIEGECKVLMVTA